METKLDITAIPTDTDKLVALVGSLVERVSRLETEVTGLRAENVSLRTENAKLKSEIAELRADNARLRRENAWLKKQLFGPKRERVDPARLHAAWLAFQNSPDVLVGATPESPPPSTSIQLLLGLTGPAISMGETIEHPAKAADEAAPPPDVPRRKKSNRHEHGRSSPPEHLPIERVVIEPDTIPEGARRIGEEVSERYGFRKASFVRVLVVRPKYACDEADGSTRVAIADVPAEMIPRGMCDPAMLARLIMGKWGDHIPWNRQEGILARDGISMSATTMAGVAKRAEPLAASLVSAMWRDARLKSKVLSIDATTAKVRAKGKCQKGYPWVVVGDRTHVLFDFSMRHTNETPKELLRGFRGYVLADASSVYDAFFAEEEGAIESACWSHGRRKFFYAAPSDERALVGLGLADELFDIERDLKPLSPSERRSAREARSRKVLESFAAWRDAMLLDPTVDPRGPLRKALNYSVNHWAALCRFLEDGHVPIHNNYTELQARHIAIGRNNWLFFGSEPDAKVACTWLSLIASAKLHGLNPEEYLRDLFRVLPLWPNRRVLELAPNNWRATRARLNAEELARPLGNVAIPPPLVAEEAAE